MGQRSQGGASGPTQHAPLRVLIAHQPPQRLDELTRLVTSLGHVAIAPELPPDRVGELLRSEQPDIAVVGTADGFERAMESISAIVRERVCPVISTFGSMDQAFVDEAARRGIFGYLTRVDPDELQAVIVIVVRRFTEYRNLEQAFGRRAVIERAKGILMVVHGVDEERAFELLRRQSQQTGRKLVDVAQGVGENHGLLAPPPEAS